MARFSSKKYFYLIIAILLFPLIFTFTVSGTDSNSNFFHSNPSLNIKVSNAAPDIEISSLPEIDYGFLDKIWYNPKVEMLIITPNNKTFIDAVKPLMDWKNEKGVKTITLSNFSSYDGVDDAEKIRNMIKTYYDKENIQWVLLAGDTEEGLIPIRKVYNPDTKIWANNFPELGNQDFKPTDFYYADLTGTWDDDNNGSWGEAPQNNTDDLDEISWIPEVYVGRLPASTATELEIMINKTLQYEVNPNIGDWMTRMLLAGGISNYADPPDDPDGEDEARLTEYIWKNYVLPEMTFTHLSRTYRFTPETPPLPNDEGSLTSFESRLNEGYSTVLFAGHGAYNQLADSAGRVYSNTDANSSSNYLMPSLIYADACTTAPYDLDSHDYNIGEVLIKQDQSGAIGFIGGLRVTWYFTEDENLEKINRGNAKLFWKEFFQERKFQQGKALYDSKVAYINSDYYTKGDGSTDLEYERKNILTYNLLGDPELDVYTNIPKLVSNPFTEKIYEGQLISTIVKDIDGKVVSNARVHLRTLDGKYYTAYADKEGSVNFRVPAQENETYNVTITGHNLIPSYFSFETRTDDIKPNILEITTSPRNPLITKDVYINIEAYDNYSGIESVFLFLSNDNFENNSFYEISNSILQNENMFSINLGRLKPGEFSYSIVIRDFANNTNSYNNDSFKFTVAKPVIDYIFPIFLILIIGVVGISIIVVYKGLQKYSEIVKKIEIVEIKKFNKGELNPLD